MGFYKFVCYIYIYIYIYIYLLLLLLLFWQTALHIAVEKGHEEIVEYLLEKGADIHATDDVR